MGYQLGVDLGTTYTAAAVGRDGRVEACTLGSASPVVPSVVLLRADGEVLVGDTAVRRGVAEPTRVAREFKRRLGDPTPLVLGGTPYGAEALMGHLLKAVVKTVTDREGAAPDRVVLTHPANYGPYKQDMMREVARLAGLNLDRVTFLTEPQAAAISYASRNRVERGEIVAVYDFGGGTFDAALVQRSDDGFSLIGRPEGMERFGGLDIDAALLSFVDDKLGGRLSALNPEDPAVQSAMLRLKDDCRAAKEALSGDSDTTIQVSAPGLSESVRVTRDDLEGMIRPRLGETVDAVRRAVASAGLDMDRVSRILLVGGSSQIPLVADTIRTATGRPVAIDAHPKFSICLGAAAYQMTSPILSVTPATPPAPQPTPTQPTPHVGSTQQTPTAPPPPPPARTEPVPAVASPAAVTTTVAAAPPKSGGPRPGLIGAIGVAVAAVVGVASFLLLKKDDSPKADPPATLPSVDTTPDTVAPTSPVTEPTTPSTMPPVTSPPGTNPANVLTPTDLNNALLTAADLSPGFTSTPLEENGNDLCGQFIAHQAVGRRSAAFIRNENSAQVQQFNHTVEAYATPADAKGAMTDIGDIVNNQCNGFVQEISGQNFNVVALGIDAPAVMTAELPAGCTDLKLVDLILTSQSNATVKILVDYVAVRCGNLISSANIQGLGDASGQNNEIATELTTVFEPMVQRASEAPFTAD